MIEKLKRLWWLRRAENRASRRHAKRYDIAFEVCRTIMQTDRPFRDDYRVRLLHALHYSFIDFRHLTKKAERSETAAKAELRRTA